MDITLDPGTYVVAVSGGVDSIVLLHILHNRTGLKLTVAHFDHGIREDSRQDRQLVQRITESYGLPFVYAEGHLGPQASEAAARKGRYEFLHKVRQASGARAVIMAHHKDDALETAVINLSRGTGRKGLTSLQNTRLIERPLLNITKQELQDYARQRSLQWREDSTNSNPAYLRNYVRQVVADKFASEDKHRLHDIISRQRGVNIELDELLGRQLQTYSAGMELDRKWFITLPHNVSLEVMAQWLRDNDIRSFDKKTLERLTHGAKIHAIGRRLPVGKSVFLRISQEFLALETS